LPGWLLQTRMGRTIGPRMVGSPERDQDRRGSGMEAFISGRLPEKLADSLATWQGHSPQAQRD